MGPKGVILVDLVGSTENHLKVLLADDQMPVRAGIKRAIELHGLRVDS